MALHVNVGGGYLLQVREGRPSDRGWRSILWDVTPSMVACLCYKSLIFLQQLCRLHHTNHASRFGLSSDFWILFLFMSRINLEWAILLWICSHLWAENLCWKLLASVASADISVNFIVVRPLALHWGGPPSSRKLNVKGEGWEWPPAECSFLLGYCGFCCLDWGFRPSVLLRTHVRRENCTKKSERHSLHSGA